MLEPKGISPLADDLARHLAIGYAKLVVSGGTPAEARARLSPATSQQLFSSPIVSLPAASAALAGLWLLHDGLDECHNIVQKSPADLQNGDSPSRDQERKLTPLLAYWHAIMHRREGDFGNAKYWYARCAGHPVNARLGAWLDPLSNTGTISKYASQIACGGWDPNGLVDLIQQAENNGPSDPRYSIAVQLQRVEWALLFEETANHAVSS